MNLYWCYRGGERGPYHIEVTRADHPSDACAVFHEPFPSPRVHALKTPSIIADCADLDAGEVGLVSVYKLPSARDWFVAMGYR